MTTTIDYIRFGKRTGDSSLLHWNVEATGINQIILINLKPPIWVSWLISPGTGPYCR